MSRGRDPSCCNYMKSSGQLALSAMWHCWCLCEQLQLLTVSDRSLIYIIGGLVINGNGVWEDPIKIWSEIWSSPLLCAIYLQLHWHIRNYWDSYPPILWWNIEVFQSMRMQGFMQKLFKRRRIVFLSCPFSCFTTEGQYKDRQQQHWYKDTKLQQEVITLFAVF